MGFPRGHRKTSTLVAGLRMTGMVAPMVLDGPINGDWFEACVTQVLVPEPRPADVVIMDNLSRHNRPAVRDRIEAAGAALRFLPPYSPDFNPIEKAFFRLKAMLRKAGERALNGLWGLIGKLVDIFQPMECANCFSSCAYVPDCSKAALAPVRQQPRERAAFGQAARRVGAGEGSAIPPRAFRAGPPIAQVDKAGSLTGRCAEQLANHCAALPLCAGGEGAHGICAGEG